jgi:hypothetical protein
MQLVKLLLIRDTHFNQHKLDVLMSRYFLVPVRIHCFQIVNRQIGEELLSVDEFLPAFQYACGHTRQ